MTENDDQNQGKKDDKNKQNSGSMGNRGVTRPMAEMQINNGSGDKQEKKDQDKDKKKKKQSREGMDMPMEKRMNMLHMHHKQTLWVYWLIVLLGGWMILFPITFNYSVGTVEPSGGREVWLTLSERIMVMRWSDIISGILLMIFGWRSLTPNRPVSLWVCCFVGIWITFAPLIFWSPTAVGYLNSTMVGALVIALIILIPGMPNMITYMKMGSQVPPGWTYNPSSWPQRWIMIVLAFFGWVVSRYLGAFQLGYLDTAWDPFFGEGTMKVLNSNMSHSFPISDGAMGALAYTFEFLMGWMGSPTRWRTMPWMVTFFGILVIPLGLVHIFLVISQPVVVGEWCTFCLLAAAIMLPMIPLEFDEVIAMGQHMVQAKRRGDNMWDVFWKGGKAFEMNKDERTTELIEFPQKPVKVFKSSVWGMSVPWTLGVCTIIGIAAMFVPAVFEVGIQKTASDIFHLSGSLIVVVSVICMGEIVRRGRYLNILLGLAMAIGPWFVDNTPIGLCITGLIAGLLVAGLSIPTGVIKERYGLWGKYVK
ncbi:vitamin K epoxide reductase family protein [Autumnicola musiva]|uniref:Vitamin K epoxide reductase family protein n=1 Tax=Autumnicola musiva TaxID=3075589 RepID=A0ABU3D619_9FLAO|nr:vitamin K epoxide reductase family protein [Zunongwangia sp. F117]MDT0676977.1 vitamin K epoxide reductase family protein [Zunongwangia sp. F117]